MITREELYGMVWSEPVLAAAKRLGVSSSYLARVCRALGVPSPPRGYWTKNALGRAPPVPALPAPRPGAPRAWAPPGERGAPIKRFYVRTPPTRSGLHGLIDGAADRFRAGSTDGRSGYLRPRKRLLVDVIASETGLARCLDFANRLFIGLERDGHRVVLAAERLMRPEIGRQQDPPTAETPPPVFGVWRPRRPAPDSWRPLRPTVAYFGMVPIGLAVVETNELVLMRYVGQGRYVRATEDPSAWPSADGVTYTLTMHREVPSGRIKLVAYSPDPTVSWKREWLETPDEPLDAGIGRILADLERAADDLPPGP